MFGESSMEAVITVFSAIGAVGVFMTGFSQIAAASMRLIGPWFRVRVANRATSRRRFLLGVAAGAGGSGVSAVVSLLSIVDSGAESAERTPWILLGINLGATAVCWLVALAGFHTTLAPAALVLYACALPLRLSPTLARYSRPDVLTGLALLMLGLDLASARVAVWPEAQQLIVRLHVLFSLQPAPLLGFAFGVLIAAMVRSSVGTVVLAMSLLVRGWLPLEAAAAIALGSNVGVALTGLLAAGGLNAEARQTALIHLILNAAASIWAAVAVILLQTFIWSGVPTPPGATGLLVPGAPPGNATLSVAAVALFHSLVHVANAVLFLPFQKPLRSLVRRLVRGRTGRDNDAVGPSVVLLPATYPEALDANLTRLQSALSRMAELAYEMLMVVINTSQIGDYAERETERVILLRSSVKQLEEEIAGALTRSVQMACSRAQAEQIQHQQRTAQQLSLISDDCFKTMRLLTRSYRRNYRFHQESRDELFDFTSQILDFLKYNSDYLKGNIDRPDWEVSNRMEDRIDGVRDRLRLRVGKLLEQSNDVDIQAELAFIDIVRHLEHVGDRCLSISESVRRMTQR